MELTFKGVICVIGFLLVTLLISSRPEHSKFISKEELHLLKSDRAANNESDRDLKKKKLAVPWRAMLSSSCVLGLIAFKMVNIASMMVGSRIASYNNDILLVNTTKVMEYRLHLISTILPSEWLDEFCVQLGWFVANNSRRHTF